MHLLFIDSGLFLLNLTFFESPFKKLLLSLKARLKMILSLHKYPPSSVFGAVLL